MVKIKRIYEQYEDSDGYRILVDRIWPRGIAKQDARINLWLKNIAPSSELRKWFAHDAKKYDAFRLAYLQELSSGTAKEALEELKKTIQLEPTVTLLYGAKDTKYNQAQILKELVG
ncbi:hypothetical protein NRIC_01870 [Enterococcus florum]|uniref:MarR family transcriptional regulator n=1 Tax=Enterococcus florum TaxID=2480627 RepID=A0A4P5P4F4_9ENTE|nr:DUF488 domain-containing protein [Enterococcus florum]GCF92296.1 hypothetical protein NRIC_01870 [Enterococcus florum]